MSGIEPSTVIILFLTVLLASLIGGLISLRLNPYRSNDRTLQNNNASANNNVSANNTNPQTMHHSNQTYGQSPPPILAPFATATNMTRTLSGNILSQPLFPFPQQQQQAQFQSQITQQQLAAMQPIAIPPAPTMPPSSIMATGTMTGTQSMSQSGAQSLTPTNHDNLNQHQSSNSGSTSPSHPRRPTEGGHSKILDLFHDKYQPPTGNINNLQNQRGNAPKLSPCTLCNDIVH
ncbi:MAG: hypothetical protein GY766_24990 [Herbaspirillum sp.]|uniref:hypothetical protein n=1 Tax=Herbaspirillum sp. TaxID=1890675 RepID=UPI002583E60F|nr:hypothetical protein [Herbaspirillum sp.]MCP3658117.1 hypothetical protein [Herbaspirillum sp.]